MPPIAPDTSLTLLRRLRQPEAQSGWRRLVGLYSSVLHAWFRAAGLQAADCDDLSQRVLEILVRRLPHFEHNGRAGAFRCWLRGIALNLLREFCRKRVARQSPSALKKLVDSKADLSRRWDVEHDRHVLHQLMEQVRGEFSDTVWRAFSRIGLDGAPARAVAGELNMTVNAVLIAKSRVLSRLRVAALQCPGLGSIS